MLAFGFGSGLAPFAPGTAGTVAAIPLFLLLNMLPAELYLAACALTFVVGIPICGASAKALGVKDHSGIVWDEFVGFWVTMAFAPSGWIWLVLGFAFFRLFDIAKPWPISWVDRNVGGGFGIMLDDLLAGLLAAASLAFISYIIAPLF
ncbi:MAG: phosphatidylglycerophosphatase A [Pseudomonadales bacterium]|nr:phosphatidylglycerophosphatase A [Pseudomonadales bacterium]